MEHGGIGNDQTVIAVGMPDETDSSSGPTASYGDLLREMRKHRWTVRTAVGASVGIALWALLTWWVGLAGLLIAVGLDAAYRVRTHSTVPAWRKMGSSERRTERKLFRLEAKGYRALHARAITDSTAQIDHLVVGPTGVFAVDSERWGRHLSVRAYPNQLYVGPFSRNEPLREARWEADRARELLREHLDLEVDVVPALAIYGPKVPWKVLHVRGVDVFAGGRVRRWIRRRRPVFGPDDVERIATTASAALPFKTEVEDPNW